MFCLALTLVGSLNRLSSSFVTSSEHQSAAQRLARRMASTTNQSRTIAGTKRVMIFGSSGMVGKGVLHEALADEQVAQVVTVGRSKSGLVHEKLQEVTHGDFLNFEPIEEQLKNVDACFWSLGVSSVGMDKADYERITKDYTVAAADMLYKHNPHMTFVYVSGMGTDADSTTHWKQIKGQTENYVLEKPWNGYIFRPGGIYPSHDETPKSTVYRVGLTVFRPLLSFVKWVSPTSITTTENIGKGFLKLSREGSDQKIFTNNEINLITKTQKDCL